MSLNCIVLSATSDIGGAICKDWLAKDWKVYGTYRQYSELAKDLEVAKMHLVPCNLLDLDSVQAACDTLIEACPSWDVLMLAPSTMEPVGDFLKVDFDSWEKGVQVNLLRQLRVLHRLLPHRNLKTSLQKPCVISFAGGGTNNAVLNYSGLVLSKISLIKMAELLDAETPDTRFVCVGPGWVKTKCHTVTLDAGPGLAGENYQRTLQKLESNDCTPMSEVIDCCNWLITSSCEQIGGRNYSVVSDQWGESSLEGQLHRDPNMYKLRRFKNDWGKKQPYEGTAEV